MNFRSHPDRQIVKAALGKARERFGFRLIHYSIQKDHLHLLVEAADKRALARGMQGLAIRVAKGVNRINGGHGHVFADRYHAHVLTKPKEVRHAVAYVLNNTRRHLAKHGHLLPPNWLDEHSSAYAFDGWAQPLRGGELDDDRAVTDPKTWLLRIGWRRHGLVPRAEVPGDPAA